MFRRFDSVFTHLLAERILLARPTLGCSGSGFSAEPFTLLPLLHSAKNDILCMRINIRRTPVAFAACQRMCAGDFMVFFLILQMPLPRIPMDLCFRLIAKQKGEHLLTKSLPSGSI